MKILAIGDPHGDLETIKQIPISNIDLILLTGDLGSATLMREMAFENIERKKQGLPPKKYSPKQEKRAFMEAYTSTLQTIRYLSKFAPVYTIFGNVESSNYETRRKSKKIGLPLPLLTDELNKIENVYVINNKILSINGRRIGGLEYFLDKRWVKSFVPEDKKKPKVAIKQTDKARRALQKFRSLDILVCHQPPHGIMDRVTAKFAPKHWQGKHAGSKLILNYIKKTKPRYVFCGHIHEGKGKAKIGKTEVYNLGVCGYKIIKI